ncbi:MAG: hypothetical protein AB3N28_08785 [Kordiimonas sp.]
MGLNEKSNAAILVTTAITFGWYFFTVMTDQAATTDFTSRLWWTLGVYTALIITISIVIAATTDTDDEEDFDERDRQIEQRAEVYGSYIQGAGLIGLLYIVTADHSKFVIAHSILGLLVFSTLVSFGLRFYFYRKG